MSYFIFTQPCEAVYEIKKSDFLAFAYPIQSREMGMEFVKQVKETYPDARHVCYGYIIGDPNNTTSAGFDDDGEPSGTAGKPILNVLQHKSIGDCIIIVVRYFGGIKLGAGGLTRAYGTAAQLVVDKMMLKPFIPKLDLQLITSFANEAQVRHIIGQFDGNITNVIYDKEVILHVQLAKQDMQSFGARLGIYAKVSP